MLYYFIGRQMKKNHSHFRKTNMANWLIVRSFLWLPLIQSSRDKATFCPLLLSLFSHISNKRCILPLPQEKGHVHQRHWLQQLHWSQQLHLEQSNPTKRACTSETLVTTVPFGTKQPTKRSSASGTLVTTVPFGTKQPTKRPSASGTLVPTVPFGTMRPAKRSCISGTKVPTVPFGTNESPVLQFIVWNVGAKFIAPVAY